MIMENRKFPAFDIHSHLDHGAVGEVSQTLNDCSLEFLTSEARRFNVFGTAYSTYASVLGAGGDIVAENEYLFDLAQENKEVYQWVVVHPDIKKTFEQAERMLEGDKVLGIKLHPPMHKYRLADRGEELFSFADRLGATVLVHPSAVEVEKALADKYANVRLIIAHLGSEGHINAVKNSLNGNIYTDTSGYLSGLNRIVEVAVERIGSEKILFGTDTYAHAFQYSRIALADVPDCDKENILYRNAARMFDKIKL